MCWHSFPAMMAMKSVCVVVGGTCNLIDVYSEMCLKLSLIIAKNDENLTTISITIFYSINFH